MQREFQEYVMCPVLENVAPYFFRRSLLSGWPTLVTAAIYLLSLPVSSVSVDRAFSKLRAINRKERVRINGENLGKYMSIIIKLSSRCVDLKENCLLSGDLIHALVV